MIYHLTFRKDWKRALATGPYSAKSLEKENFIHCSTAEQIVPVAMDFFPARRKLTILVIDETKLTSEVKWEKPKGGPPPGVRPNALFPHVYGPINHEAVTKSLDMERDADDVFILPENL